MTPESLGSVKHLLALKPITEIFVNEQGKIAVLLGATNDFDT
jgi:hypothetical protein